MSRFSNLSILIGIILLFLNGTKAIGQKNLAEKLGYPKDAKLLIIHADDLGFSHAENSASIKAMKEGVVNSASVIIPGPWVTEIVTFAKNNKDTHDFGLHLTITSEWDNYKWRPVASKDKIPSLVNEFGYFHTRCPKDASVAEVEIELRAQIDLAYAMGLKPTHLDSHMGCLTWTNRDFFEVYLKLGQEYQIPCLVGNTPEKLYPNKVAFQQILNKYKVAVVIDQVFTIPPEEFAKGTAQYYTSVLKSLQPGLSTFLIHTAYDTEEMQAITINQPNWGSTWRQADYDFFMSDDCKNIIKEEQIILVTWREISNALTKQE